VQIGEGDEKICSTFELNFLPIRGCAAGVRVMLASRRRFCCSTCAAAISQDRNAGPYGAQGATLFLMKQYALEYGSAAFAPRVNATASEGS